MTCRDKIVNPSAGLKILSRIIAIEFLKRTASAESEPEKPANKDDNQDNGSAVE